MSDEANMRRRVILINPPVIDVGAINLDYFFRVPLGLLYIGTVLKEKGADVQIIDAKVHCEHHLQDFVRGAGDKGFYDYLNDTLLKEIAEFRPDIIGIGCLFSMSFRGLKVIAKAVKEAFPDIPIAIGGVHPKIYPSGILEKYDYIDYVVIGEGENSTVGLVSCLGDEKRVAGIDGIAFREDGKVKVNPKKMFQQDINVWPFVDYSLVKADDYKRDTSRWYSPRNIPINQVYPMLTSRSCPNRCTFCSTPIIHGSSIRFRTPANVLDEMEKAYREDDIRYFTFVDDNLTFDRKRTLEIFRGILDRKMRIQFDTSGGIAIKSLDQEVVDVMVEAGMVRVNLAIESGSEFMRNKIMKKYLKTEKIYEILASCARHKDLFITGYFVIGMPEETAESLKQTFELIQRIELDAAALYYATPYPGTALFRQCIEHKLLMPSAEEYLDADYSFFKTTAEPHFKPFGIDKEDLIGFKRKVDDYMKEKRRGYGYPANYPLRYQAEASEVS